MDTRPESLSDWQEMFRGIYEEHNRKLYGTSDLLLQVMEEAGQVEELLRKEADPKEISEHLPMLFAWLMAFWNRINLDVGEAIWFKYPNVCPYCFRDQKCLCIADELKYDPKKISLNVFRRDRKKMPKSLTGWQAMIERIYGSVNKIATKKGVWFHFTEEFSELSRAWRHKEAAGMKEESADTLAWLLAFSAKVGTDLDEITWQAFPGECNVCRKEKCECPYY